MPRPEKFSRARTSPNHLGIKPEGGLWTSTYDATTGSGWVQWCLAEGYGVPRSAQWPSWLVLPAASARVVEIDTYADLARLVQAYPGPRSLHDDGRGIDFTRLGEDYDIIHLTENGQWKTRLSHPLSLYGWDCESALWLNWAVAEVTDLGLQYFGDPPTYND